MTNYDQDYDAAQVNEGRGPFAPTTESCMGLLAKAIWDHQLSLQQQVDVVRDAAPGHVSGAVLEMKTAYELVGCLRRLLPHLNVHQIHATFGAPGDFGYDTPIGDALARLYKAKGGA